MPDKLATYRAKRNFRITPEPQGALAAPIETLRFVVQRHAARHLHYDFRLELDGTLKSWAVPKGPSLDPAQKRLAVHVEDHPLDYLDFEGDIPAHQYGAGHVDVWDSGTWTPQGNPLAAYRAGKLKFQLHGEKLHGNWTLVRTRLAASGGKEQWLLIKERDERTSDDSDAAVSRSAVKAPLPATLSPQLATLVDRVPQHGDWIYEVKFDGYRLLARIDNGDVRLFTRDGKDWSAKLPAQIAALKALGLHTAWLDGEIAVLDKRELPSFQLLQNAFDRNSTATIVYFLFDLPYLNGYDLRATALAERRALLQQVLADAQSDTLRYSAQLREAPQKLLDNACRLSLEGIIGKRADSPYSGKRSDSWIKLKCRRRQEFVIAGYTEPQGSRKFFGALLLGVYDDGGLRYAGRVGTGFDSATLQSTYKQLKPLQQDQCPFEHPPDRVRRAGTHWVEPRLVAEISFAEWTADGLLRQAVFNGLRADKPAQEIRREQAISATNGDRNKPARRTTRGERIEGVGITHSERVIDPSTGLTKLDLVRYYEGSAARLLPHLKNRPVYLLRCPDGIAGEQFFQKHINKLKVPGIRTLDPALDPGHDPLMVIDDAHALVGAAQMGSVELHVCNATADRIERPDCMVFDLDPDLSLPWQSVVEGARLTKVVLDELGLRSFLKTSGGKGLHLLVPLARRHAWEEVGAFSQAIAQHLANTLPRLFSARMGEKNRVGKIFVDYLRNRRQASTVAPYSVRARPGLPVSTPMAWEELDDIGGAAQWTVTSLPERLARMKSDPWSDYLTTRQLLSARMKSQLGLAKK